MKLTFSTASARQPQTAEGRKTLMVFDCGNVVTSPVIVWLFELPLDSPWARGTWICGFYTLFGLAFSTWVCWAARVITQECRFNTTQNKSIYRTGHGEGMTGSWSRFSRKINTLNQETQKTSETNRKFSCCYQKFFTDMNESWFHSCSLTSSHFRQEKNPNADTKNVLTCTEHGSLKDPGETNVHKKTKWGLWHVSRGSTVSQSVQVQLQ